MRNKKLGEEHERVFGGVERRKMKEGLSRMDMTSGEY